MMMNARVALVLAVGMVAMAGCTKPVKVRFTAPAGSIMELKNKQYVLPAVVVLQRPTDEGQVLRQDVAFTFNKGADNKLAATGVIETFSFKETDVDRFATNTCEIGEEELKKLADGFAVVIRGISASEQLIYRMTIGHKH